MPSRAATCDSDRGFRLLESASQNTNSKFGAVATALVGAHERDDFARALVEFHDDVTGASATRQAGLAPTLDMS